MRIIFQPQLQRTISFTSNDFLASSLLPKGKSITPPLVINNRPFPPKYRQHSGRRLLQLDVASFALATIASSVAISNSIKINTITNDLDKYFHEQKHFEAKTLGLISKSFDLAYTLAAQTHQQISLLTESLKQETFMNQLHQDIDLNNRFQQY